MNKARKFLEQLPEPDDEEWAHKVRASGGFVEYSDFAEKYLSYAFCDDWLILARDIDGNLWYVNTEVWPAWADLPEGADQEPNAVEKYMLPIAKKKWRHLNWRKAEE